MFHACVYGVYFVYDGGHVYACVYYGSGRAYACVYTVLHSRHFCSYVESGGHVYACVYYSGYGCSYDTEKISMAPAQG